jgi:DNA polymerase III alpha subunit
MIQNNFGEIIFNENDICDLLMQGREVDSLKNMVVDSSVNIEKVVEYIETFPQFVKNNGNNIAIADWDRIQQSNWHMPQSYKDLDIAQYVLGLCNNEVELQRCGEELLLYQERNLFNLLRYLKYLVDIMTANNVIWGVGRGSSVASFILYKMDVHRIDSIFYKLNIDEFLR